eukprot:scaffold184669_cov26-Tisochrysis_lutea.AAC.6
MAEQPQARPHVSVAHATSRHASARSTRRDSPSPAASERTGCSSQCTRSPAAQHERKSQISPTSVWPAMAAPAVLAVGARSTGSADQSSCSTAAAWPEHTPTRMAPPAQPRVGEAGA